MSTSDKVAKIDFQDQARRFFEPQLASIGLGREDIEKQTLQELELSLERVNDAIEHNQAFGTLKLKMTANLGTVVVTSTTESHFEIGILPFLLESKRQIIQRINDLKLAEKPGELIKADRLLMINKLYDSLSSLFSMEDLEQVCFRMDLDWESLAGASKPAKVRELVRYFDKRGKLEDLRSAASKARPNAEL